MWCPPYMTSSNSTCSRGVVMGEKWYHIHRVEGGSRQISFRSNTSVLRMRPLVPLFRVGQSAAHIIGSPVATIQHPVAYSRRAPTSSLNPRYMPAWCYPSDPSSLNWDATLAFWELVIWDSLPLAELGPLSFSSSSSLPGRPSSKLFRPSSSSARRSYFCVQNSTSFCAYTGLMLAVWPPNTDLFNLRDLGTLNATDF